MVRIVQADGYQSYEQVGSLFRGGGSGRRVFMEGTEALNLHIRILLGRLLSSPDKFSPGSPLSGVLRMNSFVCNNR
jgi:hypothetical protein